MAQGLQVFDEQGNPTLDTNDRVMKILGGLYCQGNSRLEDIDYHGGLDEGEFFWFISGGSGSNYNRVSVVRDTYINNIGMPIPRVTMRLTNTQNTNNDTYFIRYGVY